MPERPVAYEGGEPYIFISYAHLDAERVLPVIAGLQARGYRVWYDAGIRAGAKWTEYVAEHLDRSAQVLAFLSANFLDSQNCEREFNFAISRRKEPVVVMLEQVELSLGMQMQMNAKQGLNRGLFDSEQAFLDELCASGELDACREGNNAEEGTVVGKVPAGWEPGKWAYVQGELFEKMGDHVGAVRHYRQAAQHSNREAEYKLGYAYMYGRGVSQSETQAVAWLEMAAEKGHAEAAVLLGAWCEVSRGDTAGAATWYAKAAQLGSLDGQVELGRCYQEGIGVDKDPAAAIGCYKKAAEQGSAIAKVRLGECYLRGDGIDRDEQAAAQWFQQAAEAGSAAGQLRLGECYELGRGVEQELGKAAGWYLKAADQEDPEACYRLGRCFKQGSGTLKDEAEAKKWFRRAIELQYPIEGFALDEYDMVCLDMSQTCLENGLQALKAKEYGRAERELYIAARRGLAQAQYQLGGMYVRGTGVGKNMEEGIKWLRSAAQQDYLPAQRTLGALYTARTEGIEDDEQAVLWNRKAALKGDALAQNNLAFLYSKGRGVEKNNTEATKWYEKAAKQGLAESQFSLAWNYEMGNGVLKSHRKAVKWYREAAKQGHEKARQKLEQLGER